MGWSRRSVASRSSTTAQSRTEPGAIYQFKALVATSPESLRDSLRVLSFSAQLQRARRFGDHPQPFEREVRLALKELAQRIAFLDFSVLRERRSRCLLATGIPILVPRSP